MCKILHDNINKKFYAVLDEGEAKLSYLSCDGYLDFYSVYVSDNLRGKGMASKILKYALDYAKDNNLKVKATCPYVQKFSERHKEYKSIWS